MTQRDPEGEPRTGEPLFAGFPAPDPEAWRREAQRQVGDPAALRVPGPSGVTAGGLYPESADVELPGQAPYSRGARALGYRDRPWEVAQELPLPSAEALGEALREQLAGGQTAITLSWDEASRGADEESARGRGGTYLPSVRELARALRGVDAPAHPIHLAAGSESVAAAALVAAHLGPEGCARWSGSAGFDPLGELARRGTLPSTLERACDELAALTRWAEQAAPGLKTLAVAADVWGDAGAGPVAELGYGLASGVWTLRELERRGVAVETALRRLRLTFAVGPDLVVETAKLRAARRLWFRVGEACGVAAPPPPIHARSGILDKTLFDPHVNALRAAGEAAAALLGSCDSLHVAPFDALLGEASSLARRLALHTQLVLREEAGLGRVADPLGGAGAVEALTDELAESAWALLQETESGGGLLEALKRGDVQARVAATARERERRLAEGEAVLVGTTRYARAEEGDPLAGRVPLRPPPASGPNPRRTDALAALAGVAGDPTQAFESMIEAARLGASLAEIAGAGRDEAGEPARVAALAPSRWASVLESLRLAVLAWREREAAPVRIAALGEPARLAERTDFARGFFESAGFRVERGEPTADGVGEAAAVALAVAEGERGRLPATLRALEGVRLYVVEAPGPDAAELRAAGLVDFVHEKADAPALLGALARSLGVVS